MMKNRSKKLFGHVMPLNQRSDDCSLHIVCDFFVLTEPLYEERQHHVTVPETLLVSVF